MDTARQITPADADIVVFNKGGRDFRIDQLSRGEEVPRDFFYGYFDLLDAGMSAAMMSSAGAEAGAAGRVADVCERAFARLTAVGARPMTARLKLRPVRNAKVLISNTDGFSLSMGLAFPGKAARPVLIGGFQGLSDIEDRSPASARPLVRAVLRRALAGLDLTYFLSPADRDAAVARYGLDPVKAGFLPFGIDTAYWRPCPEVPQENFVFAIGQDWNRDFATLVRAPGKQPIRIVTSLKVDVPAGHDHVTITPGDFSGRSISDQELRRLYNAARVVVVPSKDVHQPTGQSVSLQAMSCGRPLILTRIRGLWAPDLLRDGENCLLVPPGDAVALGAAINRVVEDRALAERLGRAARETVVAHWGLERTGEVMVDLARRGLSLYAARTSAH